MRSRMCVGCRGKRGNGTVCCRKRSGSTRRGRGRRDRFTREGRFRRIRRTTTGGCSSTTAASRGCGGGRRFPWVVSGRTVLDCTTCTGTYSSGSRIAGTGVTRALHRTGARGRAGIAMSGFCAAASGAAGRGGTSARRLLELRTVVPPRGEPVQEQGGRPVRRLRLPRRPDARPLNPYFFTSGRGPGGEAPWPDFRRPRVMRCARPGSG